VENADLLAKLEDELHNSRCSRRKRKPNSRTRCAPVLSVRKRSQFSGSHRSPGDLVIRLLDVLNHTLFWYYLASNLAYLVMLLIALKTSAAHQRRLESHRLNWIADTPMAPPITLIAPAHNEESSIRVAVRNLLELDYPELEIMW